MTPALHFPPELLLQAQGVRVVFFTLDGVLTDGTVSCNASGEEPRRFHALDRQGLALLQQAGITPVVITERDSAAWRPCWQALGVQQARSGTRGNLAAAQELLDALGLGWQQAAAMGHDWPDLPLLTQCAFACAPADAHPEIQACANHVTPAAGGHGAVRQLCDLLLIAGGQYANLLARAGQAHAVETLA